MTTIYETRGAELLPTVSRMSRPEFRAYARGLSEFDQGALEVMLRKCYVAHLARQEAKELRQDDGLPGRAAPDDGYPSIATLEEWFGVPVDAASLAERAIEAEREARLAEGPADLSGADLLPNRGSGNFARLMRDVHERDDESIEQENDSER